jgi:parallel beta-helix repeat protein
VYGRLLANGTVFTAWTDDEYGGDSNGDGPSSGVSGYWTYINLDTNSGKSILNGCTVRFAGNSNSSGAVRIYQHASEITNNTIEYSRSGIYVYNTAPRIEGNTIANNDGN